MVEQYLPGELNSSDIKFFLLEIHHYYPYLFDLAYVDEWSEKLSKFAYCACIKKDNLIQSACLYYCNQQTKIAYITLIAVSPDAVHGSGYELFSVCHHDAQKNGMEKLQLEVLKSNSHAYCFYLRQGFSCVAVHDDKLMMEMSIV